MPVHIGGHTEVAARRAGRHRGRVLPGHRAATTRSPSCSSWCARTAEEAGRDPGAIEITCGGNGVFGPGALEEAAALADLGVDRIVVPVLPVLEGHRRALAAYGDEVIARV